MRDQDLPRREPGKPVASEDLARRLDALSRADVERVLERAIHIQSQKHAAETFSPDQIRRIASELGVESSVVDSALREEVVDQPASASSSWLVPDRITERVVVAGSEQSVDDQIRGWMESEEGLRAIAPVAEGGLRWEPDRHWTTSTRLAFRSEATKALRGMPEVIHRQTVIGRQEQIVELDVATGRIRVTAWGVGAGVAVAGVGAGVTVAILGEGNNLIELATGVVPGVIAAVSTTVVIAKAWTQAIRKGMTRALYGIAHPELRSRGWRRHRRQQQPNDGAPRQGIQRLVDEVADAIDDLLD